MAKERIEAKVARALPLRDSVLNRGSDAEVEVGMFFAILNSKGQQILDPDTNEVLGNVELPKTFVKVISVDEKLSVARTFREFTIPAVRGFDGVSALMAGLTPSRPEKIEIETLKTDETRLKDEMDEKDSYVKKGDPAVQITSGDKYVGPD